MTPPVGCVVVGRNEAARLGAALRSALAQTPLVVYVDSASSDGSVAVARSTGATVIELDPTQPLSAARAYNAGVRHLAALDPPPDFVQFLDGDASLVPGWIDVAVRAARSGPRTGVVCGRRREARPGANIWHRLADLEWNTPIGEVAELGPDTLMRTADLLTSGGFAEDMIAGEEPELALRLRARGLRIVRLDHDVSVHDIAMTSWRQWWQRARRHGYAAADCAHRHGLRMGRQVVRPCIGQWWWVVVVPTIGALAERRHRPPAVLGAVALVAAQVGRIVRHRRRRHAEGWADATVFAVFCMAQKGPELSGQIEYWLRTLNGRRRGLIEYHPPPGRSPGARSVPA